MDAHMNAWVWNPPRDLFIIPGIDHPIRLYGILFALAFLFGYFYMTRAFRYCLSMYHPAASLAQQQKQASQLADRLCWFVVFGTVIGARLGHVLFYGWPYYWQNPIEILKVWKGGLASHGGATFVVIALGLYTHFVLSRALPKITFLRLLDLVAIPSAFVSFCIRMGNFFNQEIVGIPTQMPWGVIFGDPLDGPAGIPLHPAQLYEAVSYLTTFLVLTYIWRAWKLKLPEGGYLGVLFFSIFLCRIGIESVKSHELDGLHLFNLSTGQLLSIPFVVIGGFLLLRAAYLCRRKLGII